MSRNKYGNKLINYDGIMFSSLREGARYLQLRSMQEEGEITELEVQPVFVLQEKFRDRLGVLHRPITYSADFRYRLTNGQVVVEDVKAAGGKGRAQADVFRVKWKIAVYQNPDAEFRQWK